MIEIETVDWKTRSTELLAIRFDVFVSEQGFSPDLEPDQSDPLCLHVMAGWQDDAGAITPRIGTARMTPEGRIGRMAVLATWRGRGVGEALLRELLQTAKSRGLSRLTLLAQMQAVDFYRKSGFVAHGPVIQEAGVPHLAMTLEL